MIRKPIEKWLDAVDWKPVDSTAVPTGNAQLPTVTHEGILRLGGIEFRVMQLSDGQRVIDADDLQRWFDVEDR